MTLPNPQDQQQQPQEKNWWDAGAPQDQQPAQQQGQQSQGGNWWDAGAQQQDPNQQVNHFQTPPGPAQPGFDPLKAGLDFLGLSSPKNNFMAQGTTPKGEGNYGEGINGWAQKTFAKFFDPTKRTEGLDQNTQDAVNSAAQDATNTWAQQHPEFAGFKDYYKAWATASGMDSAKIQQGGLPAAISVGASEFGNATKAVVVDGIIGGVLQSADWGMRKIFSAAQAGSDVVSRSEGTTTNIQQWNPYQQQIDYANKVLGPAAGFVDGLGNFIQSLSPPNSSINLLRYTGEQAQKGNIGGAIAGGIASILSITPPTNLIGRAIVGVQAGLGGGTVERNILGDNLRASNMIYTQMSDPMLHTQIIRDVEAGTPLATIEEKYTNPWAELGGSLVFDPISWFTQIGEANHIAKAAEEAVRVAPEISDGMRAMADAGKFGDASEAASKAMQAATDVVTKAFESSGLTQSYKPLSLSANSNRFVAGRLIGDYITQTIGRFVSNPDAADHAARFVGNMAELSTAMAEGNADAKMKLMTWFASAPGGETIFSQAGARTMAVMERMLQKTDEAGNVIGHATSEEFIASLMKSAEGGKTVAEQVSLMAQKADSIMHGALEDIFPTVDKMREASQLGSKATDAQKILAQKYDELPGYVKTINAVLGKESVIGQAYAKLNGFFSSVYMGLSFGFPVRNSLNNTVTAIADSGFKTGAEVFAGQWQSYFKSGGLGERAIQDLKVLYPGGLPSGIMDAETLAKEVGGSGFFLGVSRRMENATRAILVRNSALEEIERGVRTAMPGIDALKGAHFSDGQVSYLMELVRKNSDVTSGVEEFVREMALKNGGVDASKLVQPSEKLHGFLQSFALDRVFDDARHGNYATFEELQSRIDKIKTDAIAHANLQSLTNANPAIEGDIQKLSLGLPDKEAQTLDALYSHGLNALDQAKNTAYNIISKRIETLSADPSAAPIVHALHDELWKIFNNGTQGQLGRDLSQKGGELINLSRAYQKGNATYEELTAAMKFPVGNGIFDVSKLEGVTPENISGKLWREYWPQLKNNAYGNVSDAQYAALEQLAQKIPGVETPEAARALLQPVQALMNKGHDTFDLIAAGAKDPKMVSSDAINAYLNGVKNISDPAEYAKALGEKYGITDEKQLLGIMNAGGGDARLTADRRIKDMPIEPDLRIAARRAQDTALKGLNDPNFSREAWARNFGGTLSNSIPAERKAELWPEVLRNWQESGIHPSLQTRAFKDAGGIWQIGHPGETKPLDIEQILRQIPDRVGANGSPARAFASLADIPKETADEILSYYAARTGFRETYIPPGGTMHGTSEVLNESLDGFIKELDQWTASAKAQFGKPIPGNAINPEMQTALNDWSKVGQDRMAYIKQFAMSVANQKADFALHAYGDKTYLDHALAFIYPYHYWQTRTYNNWAQRIVEHPGVLAAYGKYRHFLETAHAGMPDYYKYSLSSNDLPGINMSNPLYFNLENSLNPINGLTGVDFNDPKKRVDWTSRAMDDLGKFGPSLFTPIQWLNAARLYNQGEADAGQRWLGRLLPQSQTIKAVGALAGHNVEVDPFVNLFEGGQDPYQQSQTNRALSAMVNEGLITKEQGIDVANQRSGPIYDAAKLRASQQAAPGQLATFIGGGGFKQLYQSDQQVNNFYSDYGQVMSARPNMSPDDFRSALTTLESKYSFMDTLLIGGKSTDDSNTAFAYNVLGRIPPGQGTALETQVGLTSDMVNRFYQDKGTFQGWTTADAARFTAGIGDLSAMLALPANNTKQEWDAARAQYGFMNKQMQAQFGSDILDKIDTYFSLPKDQQQTFLNQNPQVGQAFNFKTQAYATNPTLYKYYGSIETLNRFYTSQMYATLDAKYGTDIQQKWAQYYAFKDSGQTQQAKAFYASHPELAGYAKDKAPWQNQIDRAAVAMASNMPSGPEIPIRNDFQPQSQFQKQELSAAQTPQTPQWSDFQSVLSAPLQRLVLDYWVNGDNLSTAAKSQLDTAAVKAGYKNSDDFLQAIGLSLRQPQAQQGDQLGP